MIPHKTRIVKQTSAGRLTGISFHLYFTIPGNSVTPICQFLSGTHNPSLLFILDCFERTARTVVLSLSSSFEYQ